MKTVGYIVIGILAITGCNNTEEVQKFKAVIYQDSALIVQSIQKDSEISSYLKEMSDIQANLDKIKIREKILTVKNPETPMSKESLAAQVNELDEWIVLNDKRMNKLQARLKSMTTKNDNLSNLVTHLMDEVAERDEEITALQAQLSRADDSLKHITARFNDSIVVIKKEREKVAIMKTQNNTVYYITGSIKQLQDKGIVNKQGGFIGIGKVAVINPEIDASKFTKGDLTNIKGIALNGKFRRFITMHPDRAYIIISNGKNDSIAITIPYEFWSESKYLVVAEK